MNDFSGQRLDGKIQEKRSGKRNRDTFTTVFFFCFVLLRRFRENLTKPFYFYLSRTCDSPGGTPSVISLALRGGSTRLKITWVQQRQHHRAQESARERMLSLLLSTDMYIWIRYGRTAAVQPMDPIEKDFTCQRHHGSQDVLWKIARNFKNEI